MLELLGIASLSFMAALSGAAVPGPVFMLVVSESMRGGRIAGPLIMLGHLNSWIAYNFPCVLRFGTIDEN